MTPLQMAMVAAAVANKGTVMTPRLVKQVVAPDGDVIAKLAPAHLLARDVAEDRRRDPRDDGQGRRRAARARTRRSRASGRRQDRHRRDGTPGVYDAWFVFFAPADNPVLAGAVIVERQANGFGGSVSAPIAKELMQAILPPTSNGT